MFLNVCCVINCMNNDIWKIVLILSSLSLIFNLIMLPVDNAPWGDPLTMISMTMSKASQSPGAIYPLAGPIPIIHKDENWELSYFDSYSGGKKVIFNCSEFEDELICSDISIEFVKDIHNVKTKIVCSEIDCTVSFSKLTLSEEYNRIIKKYNSFFILWTVISIIGIIIGFVLFLKNRKN